MTFSETSATSRSRTSRSTRSLAPAVELAHAKRPPPAEEDATGAEVVGAEVDERADGPLGPHRGGDDRLVQAVLERDDEPVRSETRRDVRERGLGVVRLHRKENRAELLRKRVGRHRACRHRELLDRPLDREAVLVHRGNVVGIDVAEEHRVAVPREPGSHRPADRAGAYDDVLHGSDVRRGRQISASSANRQSAFTSVNCSTVLQSCTG